MDVLLLFDSSAQLDMTLLAQVYRESIEKGFHVPYGGMDRSNQDFEDFWRRDFFSVPGAVCAVWEQDGKYMSALRSEPYRDGSLITGLETAPEHRCKGIATKMLSEWLHHFRASGGGRLYSHIDRRNRPSIRVHRACGFSLLLDYAVFLDGSVSQSYDTYVWDVKRPR